MSRDMIDQEHKNVYENDMKFGYGIPPMYMTLPAYSGVTSVPISRKRLHETVQTAQFVDQNENETVMFLGNDISMQIYQQQLEIDQFIAHHVCYYYRFFFENVLFF